MNMDVKYLEVMIISALALSIIVFIYCMVFKKISANEKSGISEKSNAFLLAIIAYFGLPFLLAIFGCSLTFLMSFDVWDDVHPKVELKK